MNKGTAKPTMNVTETAENVKFQQEYKRALKQQNKTFNQNGKNLKLATRVQYEPGNDSLMIYTSLIAFRSNA